MQREQHGTVLLIRWLPRLGPKTFYTRAEQFNVDEWAIYLALTIQIKLNICPIYQKRK